MCRNQEPLFGVLMLRALKQLFLRFLHEHMVLEKPGFDLVDQTGMNFGHLDLIRLRNGRLEVEGWADASQVVLIQGTERCARIPDLARADVLHAIGKKVGRTPGFVLDLPFRDNPFYFVRVVGTHQHIHTITGFERREVRRAQMQLLLPFLHNCLRALPAFARWSLWKDAKYRTVIKTRFGIGSPEPTEKITPHLFKEDVTEPGNHVADVNAVPATIILPVFNALDLLPDVLARVMTHTDLPFELIIVEDCSTDPGVRPFLHKWFFALTEEEKASVTIVENVENLGFIGSVNTAMERAIKLGHHVVLLNSDAFVPTGWASRLLQPLIAHARVASVTPMSNDAEIFSAPVICVGETLQDNEADKIDAVAQRLMPDAALCDAPTGVGFCMAMHIDALRSVPQLDQVFNPGYGEEVDWCQRVAAKGWRHLGHGGLYVEHRSGTSFGSKKKANLVAAHNKIVSNRYPNYDQAVQDFIARDPMAGPRLVLALAWAAERQVGPVPVYLGHALGGGADHYLDQRIAMDVKLGSAAVVVRAGGSQPWQIEVHTKLGVTRGETSDASFVYRLISLLPQRRIVYSCGVGAKDLSKLPAMLLTLSSDIGASLEILFHDFLPVSPSYTLLDSKNRYDLVLQPDGTEDKAHLYSTPDGDILSLTKWRELWGAAVTHSERIIVFSENSRNIVAETFPDASKKIAVAPHTISLKRHKLSPSIPSDGVPVIGVLGAIGVQKGAQVLQSISSTLAKTGKGRLAVIGYVDPAYPLDSSTMIHGPYKVRDIPSLTKRYNISCWLIPSIWPETFSYTTHEALSTGLPVWSFDIGAQGDTVRKAAEKRGQGGCIPLNNGSPDVDALIDALLAPQRIPICDLSQSA